MTAAGSPHSRHHRPSPGAHISAQQMLQCKINKIAKNPSNLVILFT
jgi:hypothetical protein